MKQLEKFCRSLAVIGLFFLVAGTGTAFGSASYSSSGILHLSQVDVLGEGMYEVFFRAADRNGQEFILQSASLFTSGLPADATFDRATGELHILALELYGSGRLRDYATVDMVLIPGSDPMRFRVTTVVGLNLPYGAAGSSTIAGIVDYRGNIVQGSGFEAFYWGEGLYGVDFGTSVSRFVCSCTVSVEDIQGPSDNLLNQEIFGIGCIIIKGGVIPLPKNILSRPEPEFNSNNTIFFGIPPFGPVSFHFICVKS